MFAKELGSLLLMDYPCTQRIRGEALYFDALTFTPPFRCSLVLDASTTVFYYLTGKLRIDQLADISCKQTKEEFLVQDIFAFARGSLHGKDKATVEQIQPSTPDEVPEAQRVGGRTPDHGESGAVEQGPGEGADDLSPTHHGAIEASLEKSAQDLGLQTSGGGVEQDGADEDNEENQGGRGGEAAKDPAAASTATARGISDEAAQVTAGAGAEATGGARDEKTDTRSASPKEGDKVSDKEAKDISGAGSGTAGAETSESTTAASTETWRGGGSDEKAEDEAGVSTKMQQEASGKEATDKEPGASIETGQEARDKVAEDKGVGTSKTEQQASGKTPRAKIGASSEIHAKGNGEGSGDEKDETRETDEEPSNEGATDKKPGASTQSEQETSDEWSEVSTDVSSETDEEEADAEESGGEESNESGETNGESSDEGAEVTTGAAVETSGGGSDEAAKDTTSAATEEKAQSQENESKVVVQPTPAPRRSKSFAARKGVNLKLIAIPLEPPKINESLGSIIARGFSQKLIERVKWVRQDLVFNMVKRAAELVGADYRRMRKKGPRHLFFWLNNLEDDVFHD
ncbi:hypothetical protein Esti_002960 [Eimeria stiedai]